MLASDYSKGRQVRGRDGGYDGRVCVSRQHKGVLGTKKFSEAFLDVDVPARVAEQACPAGVRSPLPDAGSDRVDDLRLEVEAEGGCTRRSRPARDRRS